MGVFVRRKWAASGAGTLAVGNFAILEVVYGFSEESFNSAKFYVGYFPANLNYQLSSTLGKSKSAGSTGALAHLLHNCTNVTVLMIIK